MTSQHRRTALGRLALALLLPMAALSAGAGPASAAADGDSAAEVTARCSGGPGRVTLAVEPPDADGDYTVTATTTGLVEGSEWRVLLEWEEDGQQHRFRRTAVDGSWAATATFGASDVEPTFNVEASGSLDGEPRFSCFDYVVVGPRLAGGLGECGNGALGMFARQRDDGAIAVGAFLLRGPSKQRWDVEVRAVSDSATQTVSFQDYSNRWSELGSRVRFEGLGAAPRFRLQISNGDGVRCRLWLSPGAFLTMGSSAAPSESSVPRLMRRGAES